jgi:hypothetical protein
VDFRQERASRGNGTKVFGTAILQSILPPADEVIE